MTPIFRQSSVISLLKWQADKKIQGAMSSIFIVKRVFGHHTDYLSDWDARWGTSCRGSERTAMRFPDFKAAEEAAERADKTCRGRGSEGMPEGMEFTAIEVKGTKLTAPDYMIDMR